MLNDSFYLMSEKIGDMVRIARLNKGWSQRELARRIKKSPTYIHYVERGFNPSSRSEKFTIGVEAVDDLARELGLNPDEARLAAGYAAQPRKAKTATEALEIMENSIPGFEGILTFEGITDENAQRILDDFLTVIELHKRRNG